MVPRELAEAIEDREHWRVDGDAAVYEPPGGWVVRIRQTYQPAKNAERWHAALYVREGGPPQRTALEYSAPAAVQWAEHVRPGRG